MKEGRRGRGGQILGRGGGGYITPLYDPRPNVCSYLLHVRHVPSVEPVRADALVLVEEVWLPGGQRRVEQEQHAAVAGKVVVDRVDLEQRESGRHGFAIIGCRMSYQSLTNGRAMR